MTVGIKQHTEYSDGVWSWSVWLDGPDDELDKVEYVLYTLHSSYNKPLRRVQERRTRFRLDEEGFSSSPLSIEIHFRDGSKRALVEELDLESRTSSLEGARNQRVSRASFGTPKKMLSIDSGGLRSLISIKILAKLESILQREHGPRLTLSNYFDYIGGTSTGAAIAAFLSMGLSVAEVENLFVSLAPYMFTKASLLDRLHYQYSSEPLAIKLKEILGADTKLGSDSLRTLLMIVVRNATTDEAWPLSNNPLAKYNDPKRVDSNLEMPLWQIVRASTATPIYFPPEVIRLGSRDLIFVDGAVSTYANPSMLLFLMATAKPYRLEWPVGEKKILLVSVGSGEIPSASSNLRSQDMNLLYNATAIPAALMKSARIQQDTLCRMFGTCRVGPVIDRELGDMQGHLGPGSESMFTYVRYEPLLDSASLVRLGLSDLDPNTIIQMDSMDTIADLQRVGKHFSELTVSPEHLRDFV